MLWYNLCTVEKYWSWEGTVVELHVTDLPLEMFQSQIKWRQCSDPFAELCFAAWKGVEGASWQWRPPWSPLATSQLPASSQLCLIMMLWNQPSCPVTIFFVWQNERRQPRQKSRALHMDYKTEMCVILSCSWLQFGKHHKNSYALYLAKNFQLDGLSAMPNFGHCRQTNKLTVGNHLGILPNHLRTLLDHSSTLLDHFGTLPDLWGTHQTIWRPYLTSLLPYWTSW